MKIIFNFVVIIFFLISLRLESGIVNIDNSLSIEIIEKKGDISNRFIFVAIHNNERDAIKTLRLAVENYGGKGFIFINRSRPGQRIIRVKKGRVSFLYDPNRIFSLEGIIETLKYYNSHFYYIKNYAIKYLRKISVMIIKELGIVQNSNSYIISLHNNIKTSDLSVKLFERSKYKVIIKKPLESKNFVLVNDKKLFERLSELDINVVFFQGKYNDGSLGYFCTKNNYKYINIETRFGEFEKQVEILKKVINKIYEDMYDYYFYVI
ncbi:MAG TPA: hypothetical protein PKW55_08260 [Spirochaetota bacterium]|nr:hypothetical protein [Spirochaetota bacterium]HOM39068.1 hypothetical protein [Spirochaetota bacterium]HPQ49974.1 hypothetical protein [Spirochaetota bacterium]